MFNIAKTQQTTLDLDWHPVSDVILAYTEPEYLP